MTELLPCPFCGGESKELDPPVSGYWMGLWRIRCTECGATINGAYRGTNREAWNRRAERTCLAKPYEVDGETGFYDCIECECGEVNDVSARYCNGCGGLIEVVYE